MHDKQIYFCNWVRRRSKTDKIWSSSTEKNIFLTNCDIFETFTLNKMIKNLERVQFGSKSSYLLIMNLNLCLLDLNFIELEFSQNLVKLYVRKAWDVLQLPERQRDITVLRVIILFRVTKFTTCQRNRHNKFKNLTSDDLKMMKSLLIIV